MKAPVEHRGVCFCEETKRESSRIDPLLQRVPELLRLDGLSQGPEGGLKLHDGWRQIPEPAACTPHLLQHLSAFTWRHKTRISP